MKNTFSLIAGPAIFFFQAEDGIRDYKVTGVQTCALPIYFISGTCRLMKWLAFSTSSTEPARFTCDGRLQRSEERRVGKECRARWSPSQYKKKQPKHEKA